MASLRDGFDCYYAPSDDAIEAALRTGLVSLDTNVLLSLYRLQPQARDELLRVLGELGDQLWIPHQVAHEFHQNRLNVIAEQERFFGKAREDLKDAIDDYVKKFRAFANRISLLDTTVQELIDSVQGAHAAVSIEVANAEAVNEVHLAGHGSDEIRVRLEDLLADRVGDPMDSTEMDDLRKEAKRRIEARIPPGYMDRGKSDPTGDCILWKQLIREASKRRLPVVFITDDRKEDWFRREHGLTLGPRVELYEEMRKDADVPFFLMTTATFLVEVKKHLSARVSTATVSQAEELPASIDEERMQFILKTHRQLHEELAELEVRRERVTQHYREHEARLNYLRSTLLRLQRKSDNYTDAEYQDIEVLRRDLSETEFQIAPLDLERRMLDEHIRRVRDDLSSMERLRPSQTLSGIQPLGDVKPLS